MVDDPSVGATLPAATQAATAPDGAQTIRLSAALSRSTYGAAAPTPPLLLKLDYATSTAGRIDRPPLNIALVLDRSGSMAEDQKFPYTLQAARWVIENMTDHDTLSIIAFNDGVAVLAAAGRVVNKPFLFHRLEEIEPQGWTDLSAGLLEGIAQVQSRAAAGQVRAVFVLTDGMANRGVTDSNALRNIAQQAHGRGIGISTFGCGTEFNEKLLADLASAGAGRYTYVKASEQIPAAFKDELHGILQAVAQNGSIEISVKGGQIVKAYGQFPDVPARSHRIGLGNLRGGERGVLLLAIEPQEFSAGAAVEAEARLTFDDVRAGQRTSAVARAAASFSPDAPAQENEDVTLYARVLDALELAEQAVAGLDKQRQQQARDAFDQVYEPARQHALAGHDQELLNTTFLLKHFMDELSASADQGLIHSHEEARQRLRKEADYERYMMTHHRR